jgi:LmbE family N-acetylglucosaminyl deacetylase
MIKFNNLINKVFPKEYNIVFFHDHPDDESFLSAGLLNELTLRGRKCTVVFGVAAIVNRRVQTIARQKEIIKACNILGVSSILYLDFCDFKYSKDGSPSFKNEKIAKISQNLLSVLHKNGIQSPFILVSYDRNGGYGNVDHKKINAVGRDFYRRYKNSVISLFELTINRDKMFKWLGIAKRKFSSQFMPKLSYWSDRFGLPEDQIAYYYQLTERQIALKRRALMAHKSQNKSDEFPLSLSDDDFKELFGYEFISIQKPQTK